MTNDLEDIYCMREGGDSLESLWLFSRFSSMNYDDGKWLNSIVYGKNEIMKNTCFIYNSIYIHVCHSLQIYLHFATP